MSQSPIPPLPKLPLVMLGALTLVSFGGPLVMLLMIRGGERSTWPPDRAVEWGTIWVAIGLVVGLMAAAIITALRSRKGPR